ncbi:MAG: peptide chain release factor N(5)-glutamine methyltransferase [Holosporales bacterium]|jgi:release factor glutamine methyltransferase|nr:peptide chain release factor N(5)-glutamine methyltransferase [Holosporales bacterium]
MILNKSDLVGLAESFGIPPRETLLLLAHILSTNYTSLFFAKETHIPDVDYRTFLDYLRRHSTGEPIAKIIEKKEFYGLEFKTTRDTLDPRPETEKIIDLFREGYPDTTVSLGILDLGAGTGCIGITILSLYPAAECTFVDIDEKALNIARYNSENLGVSSRSKFIESDWFSMVEGKFDAIVTNPPYVREDYDLRGGTLFDPPLALFGGFDGQRDVHNILRSATKYLKTNGILIMEGLEISGLPYILKMGEFSANDR